MVLVCVNWSFKPAERVVFEVTCESPKLNRVFSLMFMSVIAVDSRLKVWPGLFLE